MLEPRYEHSWNSPLPLFASFHLYKYFYTLYKYPDTTNRLYNYIVDFIEQLCKFACIRSLVFVLVTCEEQRECEHLRISLVGYKRPCTSHFLQTVYRKVSSGGLTLSLSQPTCICMWCLNASTASSYSIIVYVLRRVFM